MVILSSCLVSQCSCRSSSDRSETTVSSLHHSMTSVELLHYFDTTDSKAVDAESYQLVEVRRLKLKEKRGREKDNGTAVVQMSAFGRVHTVTLRQNKRLFFQGAEVILAGDEEERLVADRQPGDCHYIIDDERLVGGLSDCGGQFHGFFMDGEEIYDILPLRPRLHALLQSKKRYHLLRTASKYLRPQQDNVTDDHEVNDFIFHPKVMAPHVKGNSTVNKRANGDYSTPVVVEMAVFLDCKAYRGYLDFYKNQNELVDLILSLVNGMQGIYHYPSLGREVSFCIMHIELQKKCILDYASGEREAMLMNFCKYQDKYKKEKAKSWDMGLLLTGTDMYGKSTSGSKSFATMGLAPVGGVCEDPYGCVVGEIGVTDAEGRPYPCTGFLSMLIMAHEVGHNLGMHHDSVQNRCPRDGHVMSPTRGVAGEVTWSSCSRELLHSLDKACLLNSPTKVAIEHLKYAHSPGKILTASKQCQFLMKDPSAHVQLRPGSSLRDICNSMVCASPYRSGPQSAGPALDGTDCGDGKLCFEGVCQHKNFHPLQSAATAPVRATSRVGMRPSVDPKWGEWRDSPCSRLSCLRGSSGISISHRRCEVPEHSSGRDCIGASSRVKLCHDAQSNCVTQQEVGDFASAKCAEVLASVRHLSERLSSEGGRMMPFNRRYPRRACQVHCKVVDGGRYFAPVEEAEKAGLSATFPDGTLCHQEGGKKFYCMEGICRFPFSRGGRSDEVDAALGKMQVASPNTDNENEEFKMDPFFLTKEDGSPEAGQPEDDFDPEKVQFDVDDEVERRW